MRDSNGLVSLGERYRAVNILRFPVGDGLELAAREQDHLGVVLRPEIAAALQARQSFATLQDHAAALHRVLAGTALEVLDPGLLCHELDRVGLLESERAFVERCRLDARPSPTSHRPRVGAIGWITRDRPEALQRAVLSYVTNFRRHGRSLETIVVDDSPSATARARNRDLLESTARSLRIDIRYAGSDERAAYGATLAARADVPREIVDFALGDPLACGCTIGAARNVLLLDTLGRLALSADDDTVCRPTCHPEARQGLRLYGRRDPTEVWSFVDRESALAQAPTADIDVVAAHEAALGRSLAALVREALEANYLSWGQLSTEDIRLLEAGTGRVITSFTGVVGDSGMPTHAGLLWGLDEPSRSRVFQHEAAYRTTLTSREVLRVAPVLSAGARSHCMGTAYGFDNRSLLPPFMPVRRNEDGVFGAVLTACHDDAVFTHLPVALTHDAAPRAKRLRVESPIARRHLSDILLFCVFAQRRSPGWHSCAKRLDQLGSHLQEVGMLSLDELQRFLRLQLATQASVFFALLEGVRREYGQAPAHWAADLTRCAHEAREALQHPDAILPLDLAGASRSREDILTLTRGVLRRFGELLRAWPQIVAAARELRDADIRPSRSLGTNRL